jgi:hypothetical protein
VRGRLPILTRTLLLAALAVRLLVPTGWMPVAAANGGITLVPCVSAPVPEPAVHYPPAHGHGVSKHGAHHASDQPDRNSKPHDMPPGECAFAPLSSAFALPLDSLDVGFAPQAAQSVERAWTADPVARGPPSLLLPPATGPPPRT